MRAVILAMLLSVAAWGQPVNPPPAILKGTPPGGIGAACSGTPLLGYLNSSGQVITCVSLVWTVTGGGGGSSPWSSATGKIFPTTLTDFLGLGTNDPQAPLDIAYTVSDNSDEAGAQAATVEQVFSGSGADVSMEGLKFESSYTGTGNMLLQLAAEFSLVNDGMSTIGEGIGVLVNGLHGPAYTNFTGLYVAGSQTGHADVLCGVCIGDMTHGGANYAIQTGAGTVDFSGSTNVLLPSDSTATTQSAHDNSTKVATTAYVDAAAGGGGGMVLIEQHTASTSAALNFTSCISSTYDTYVIELVNLIPAGSTTDLLMQYSADGGSTYDTGANYGWDRWAWRYGASATGGGTGQTAISFFNSSTIDTSTANGGVTGTWHIYSPLSTTMNKQGYGSTAAVDGSGILANSMSGTYYSTAAQNAFRIMFGAGNITSGTARCYGLAK